MNNTSRPMKTKIKDLESFSKYFLCSIMDYSISTQQTRRSWVSIQIIREESIKSKYNSLTRIVWMRHWNNLLDCVITTTCWVKKILRIIMITYIRVKFTRWGFMSILLGSRWIKTLWVFRHTVKGFRLRSRTRQ